MNNAFRRAFAVMVIGMLAACGGDGGGSGADEPTPPVDDGGGGNNGGDGGSGGDGGGDSGGGDTPDARSCAGDFGPDRIDEGEDCAPVYHAFCDSTFGDGAFLYEETPPCDGVTVETVTGDSSETFAGFLDYVVLRPTGVAPRAVVTSLHFRQILREPATAAHTFAAQMRLAELVRGRQVMVILPGAPGGNWQQTPLPGLIDTIGTGGLAGIPLLDILGGGEGGDNPLLGLLEGLGLPIGLLDDLLSSGGTLGDLADVLDNLAPLAGSADDYLEYIRIARDDALQRFGGADLPQFVSGLSNGGLYAMRLACRYPDEVDAFMSVAGAVSATEAEACMGQPPVGSVQVHGVNDTLSPYVGVITYPIRGGVPPIPVDLLDGGSVGIGDGLTEAVLGEQPGLFLDVFAPNNACGGELRESVQPAGVAGMGEQAGDVVIERFAECSNAAGKQSYMVTITQGGHNWPGYDAPSGQPVNLFGAVSYDFDATLFGFDLMWRAAGLD